MFTMRNLLNRLFGEKIAIEATYQFESENGTVWTEKRLFNIEESLKVLKSSANTPYKLSGKGKLVHWKTITQRYMDKLVIEEQVIPRKGYFERILQKKEDGNYSFWGNVTYKLNPHGNSESATRS